jgi:hypothetical protein
MKSKIVYFEENGPENTEATFKLVQERLCSLEIKKIVLASTTGATAEKAMDFFKNSGIKLIVVQRFQINISIHHNHYQQQFLLPFYPFCIST